jgi:hypothetical protein
MKKGLLFLKAGCLVGHDQTNSMAGEEATHAFLRSWSSITTSLTEGLVVTDVQLFIKASRESRPALKKAWS